MNVAIRLAAESDLVAINEIYNHYVAISTCTYQETPEPLERRQLWFDQHDSTHPATVAVLDHRIVGWGSLSHFHTRCAFRFTVEHSLYVHHQFHRRGIGTIILADLIERTRKLGHHAMIAAIDSEQLASVALHEKFGFVQVGRLKQVGFKFNRWLDVIYMELLLK